MKYKKYFIVLLTSLLAVFFDQLTKTLIRHNLGLNESVPLGNILHLSYITNTGSAFGLFKGANQFFIVIDFIAILLILYFIKETKDGNLAYMSFGMLLGGTIGNLIDRIIYGHVIDFIDFRFWPVFNVADSAVTIGVILLLLIIILWEKK